LRNQFLFVTATEPQPTGGANNDEARIAEAMQKFQSGTPIAELLTEYAYLIPKFMASMGVKDQA